MPDNNLPIPPRILVVEDEFLIRLTLVEALGDEGFEVIEAESGDAGLVALETDTGIQLLLTDIQLPGSLDGRALARRARESRPDLPIVYMTGRPDPAAEAGARANERYIAKPYTLADICKAVRDLLAL
jgi:CheY-like chemotaxis protein